MFHSMADTYLILVHLFILYSIIFDLMRRNSDDIGSFAFVMPHRPRGPLKVVPLHYAYYVGRVS